MKLLRLGLDIGTNSIGWALVDENNKIIKKNGHSFWGVRLFEEGKSALERGNNRRNRRRLARRKERVNIIRELFLKEINDIDPSFYERLDDSFYFAEDKRNKNIHNLFITGYTDKEFFNEYPTIYHLRNAMMKEDRKFDIRMLYLVVTHIVKYRGNFLYTGEEFSFSDISIVSDFFESFNNSLSKLSNEFEEDEYYSEKFFGKVELNESFYTSLKEILVNISGITNKKNKLIELFKVDKKSLYNELVIPLLSGTKVNLANLSIIKDRKYEKIEIEFNDELEKKLEDAVSLISELSEVLELIKVLKNVIDYYFINKVLGNNDSISAAMIKIYEKHKKDLKLLKEVIKKYIPEKYNEVFRLKDEKLNNYVHYIGFNSKNNKVERLSHLNKDDFYKYIKKILEEIKVEDDDINYILTEISNGNFLCRQNSNQNGAFPKQLHYKELKEILNKQSKYHPFLNDKTDEYTTLDKILKTFDYKIPYYVGPLNNNSSNSWVVRTNEKILPWNFEKVIDKDKTAEEFIRRMQNKCTYLKGEKDFCLPKYSILFSEYNCLSYLNKIKVNGALINPELKNKLFNEVFLVKKQPTKKDIIANLKSNYGNNLNTTTKELPEVNCNMASYIKMKEIFGVSLDIDTAENIIKDITIFEDKDILQERLDKVYKLSQEKISKIKGLNYKGYGRLCKRLLDGIIVSNNATGEVMGTIIEIMRNTNMNLQEILYYQDFNTREIIDAENNDDIEKDEYSVEDYINDNLIMSPSFKRPLIQSYTIIKEIEKIFNRPIDEFYIECTRTNKAEKKKTTVSRYEKVKNLLNSCTELANQYNIDLSRLKYELEIKKDSLRVDKLYFYFTQLGKCMYSLEDIDISELDNNYTYDIDHIYPQSIIKDDSLSNRVLVNKKKNAAKTDTFLFDANVLNPKAPMFYKKLLDLELISKEKYRRLTQKELSAEELDGFVNRQLVSTNQAVKGLIEILRNYHNVEEKNIIFSKGENVSDFRRKFELVKSRTANNFHHAHDAYLNVIVGGVLNQYYNSRSFFRFGDIKRIQCENESVNPDKIFERTIIKANGRIIWNKEYELKKIKHDLYERFDITETFRTYNPNEMLAKVSILPAGNGTVAVKTTTPRANIDRYGGINSNSFSKYVILKKKTKKGIDTILEAIPRMYSETENDIDNYIKQIYPINDKCLGVEVVNYNIKVNSIVEMDKRRFVITGKTGDSYLIKNAKDRFFSKRSMETIKKLDKYLDNKKYNNIMPIVNESIIISPANGKNNKEIILDIEELRMLLNNIYELYSKNIYNYSIICDIANTIKSILKQESNDFDYKIESYIILCNNLLSLLKTNERKIADLTICKKSKNSGVLNISKTLKPGTKFIWQSITGYYEKVLYEVD